MKNKVLYAIVSLLALTGCGSMKNMSREDRAGVGAQIGAFVGWLFGGAVGNTYAAFGKRLVKIVYGTNGISHCGPFCVHTLRLVAFKRSPYMTVFEILHPYCVGFLSEPYL